MKGLKALEGRFGVASGTLFLTVCTILIKGVGFLYKIPLFNALGASGAGLYQMVFSTFSLLIALTISGVPSGMTKIIASGKPSRTVLKIALKIFMPIGVGFSIGLYLLAGQIAIMQGNEDVANLYKVICLSIMFTSIIACFRGYFQGLSNLRPTAISQLIEQFARATLGIIFFKFSNGGHYEKTAAALFAVTISELLALIFLVVFYFKCRNKQIKGQSKGNIKGQYKLLILTILPLTAIGLLSPLANFIDSVTAVNLLKSEFGSRATEMYGSYAGSVQAIIGLPIAVLHSLALGFLPKLSKGGNNYSGAKKLLTAIGVLSFICYILIIIFSPLVVKILFKGLEKGGLVVKLLRVASINVIALSLLTASNLILLSKGRQSFSLISMPIGLVVKTIINLTLLKNPKINIFGLIISDAGCYFVALFLNLLYIIYCNKKQKAGKGNEDNASGHGCRQGGTIAKRI